MPIETAFFQIPSNEIQRKIRKFAHDPDRLRDAIAALYVRCRSRLDERLRMHTELSGVHLQIVRQSMTLQLESTIERVLQDRRSAVDGEALSDWIDEQVSAAETTYIAT
jgi:hypothetical protein